MIVAVGIDIVELKRIKDIWQRHPERLLYRHFTPEEILYCRAKADPLPSIGARFAAKEAFQKCWFENHGWQDVWVEMDGVKPKLHFAANIQAEMDRRNLTAHLSLTNERNYAAAMVVLEARPQKRRLKTLFAPFGHGFTGNPPVVGVDLFDDHHGRRGVFTEHVDQQLRRPFDERRFLLGRRAFSSDFDVDVGHKLQSWWELELPKQSIQIPLKFSPYKAEPSTYLLAKK